MALALVDQPTWPPVGDAARDAWLARLLNNAIGLENSVAMVVCHPPLFRHQVSASATYAFSKRTSGYISGVWQIVSCGAHAQVNGLVGPDGAPSNANQAILRVGLMTFF